MKYQRRRRCAALLAVVSVALGAVAGCTPDTDPTERSPKSLRDRLPEQILSSGKLTVGTDRPYPLDGLDTDVIEAVATSLDLTVEFVQKPRAQVLPGIPGLEYDMAAGGFADTAERRNRYDMVSYFSAGTQWARKDGGDITPDDACGRRVGAVPRTVQFTRQLPAESKSCTAAGQKPLEIIGFDSVDDAIVALSNGGVDAVSADSSSIGRQVQRSGGVVTTAGPPFDVTPVAFAVINRSMLGPVLQTSVQKLIDDGDMRRIAERWGVADGVIPTSTLDGAVVESR